MGFVTVKHPDIDQTAEVPDDLLEHWAERGWQPVDAGDTAPATVVLTKDGDNAVVPVDVADSWRADGWTDASAEFAPDPSAADGEPTTTDQEADQ